MSPVESPQDTSFGPVEYVGFWIRFLAFGIDSLAATLLISPLVVMMLGDLDTDLEQIDLSNSQALLDLLLKMSVNMSVETLLMGVVILIFWIYKSATPGKMVFRAVIVNASDGASPSKPQLVIRYLGYFVSTLVFGLGFLAIATDRRKQGWHDKMAGTIVIKSVKNSANSASSL